MVYVELNVPLDTV